MSQPIAYADIDFFSYRLPEQRRVLLLVYIYCEKRQSDFIAIGYTANAIYPHIFFFYSNCLNISLIFISECIEWMDG